LIREDRERAETRPVLPVLPIIHKALDTSLEPLNLESNTRKEFPAEVENE
jgi:hypothetical protein